jgi:hypothetical protein
MESKEFKRLRKKLDKTQKQMSQLLGVSLKAIHSYEQGWRTIPPAVERQVFFLAMRAAPAADFRPCWELRDCPEELRLECPAWEFKSGDLCWFINGTICDGSNHRTWPEKMKICRVCPVFASRFNE